MNYNVDERYNSVVITLKGNVMRGPDGSKLHDTACIGMVRKDLTGPPRARAAL